MSSTARQAAAVGAQTVYDIGMAGYRFPYPVALIDLSRRNITGAGAAGQVIGCGRADAFVDVRVFPAQLRDAVRPGFGTLYSVAGLDRRDEPPVVPVPSAGGCLTSVESR